MNDHAAENKALTCQLQQCYEKLQKAELEKEEFQKKIEKLERELQNYLGQIQAFRYCIDRIGG